MDVESRKIEIVPPAAEKEVAGDDLAMPAAREISFVRLFFSCMVAGGVQYGLALQLSLLTPYIQALGLWHALPSPIWLCGPIVGFVVQPIVGLCSDECKLKFGRRRPFIISGCLLICVAELVIGFSSDIGYAMGDVKVDCRMYRGPRWIAAVAFIIGFWMLHVANNAVQGPSRALMADLSGRYGCNAANAIFASWMAFGNILGYSSGSTVEWHNWFPFLQTRACCEACANLKGAFLVAVVFLLICMTVTVIVAKEVPLSKLNKNCEEESETEVVEIFRSIKILPPGMHPVLLVTGLTWLSWFPFMLLGTDWMGREVYHGDPIGYEPQTNAYDRGVRAGAFGLLLNSVVLAIGSFMIEPLCRNFTPRLVWVSSNFMVCVAMSAAAIISAWSSHKFNFGIHVGPDGGIKVVALLLFTSLGLPLAVLYSVPFAVTGTLAARHGGGQGLCTGVLNISIVIPQVIVALGAGPWNELFGKGNIPAFALASAFAFICGILGLFILPRLSGSNFKSSGMGGMR